MTRQSFILYMVTFIFARGLCEKCSLPESWNGAWFITEFANGPDRVVNSSLNTISRDSLEEDDNGPLGSCIWKNDDFYVFRNAQTKCIKCTIITERHENVLYSRESYCSDNSDENLDSDELEAICLRFRESHDEEDQYFWFRKNYKPVKCPFKDSSYQFSYSRSGGKLCAQPVSRSSTCWDNTKMDLHYEACHDNHNSNRKDYELTCMGDWEETSEHRHFVADMRSLNYKEDSYRERFRCFTYRPTWSDSAATPGREPRITGYEIGTSDVATCKELERPDKAETTLYLKNEIEFDAKPCSFPSWFSSHNWINMEKTVEFEVDTVEKNRSIQIHPVWKDTGTGVPNPEEGSVQNLFSPRHGRLVCLQKRNLVGNTGRNDTTAILAKYTVGCKVDIICMQMISQSPFIIQMNYLEGKGMEWEALRELCFDSNSTSYYHFAGVTMISTRGQKGTCHRPGIYLRLPSNETNGILESEPDSDNDWRIGCDYEFGGKINEFSCLDGWKDAHDDSIQYTVISPDKNLSKSSPLYCMKTWDALKSKQSNVQITSQDCVSFKNESSSGSDLERFDLLHLRRKAFCNSTPVAAVNSNSHLVADAGRNSVGWRKPQQLLSIIPISIVILFYRVE